MAHHVIVEKLNRELAEPINSERQVVYILAETRKLLELAGMRERFPQLTFFCNWAMHPTLDRGPAEQIIGLFDGTVAATRTGLPTLAELEANPNAMLEHVSKLCSTFDIVGFGEFKKELERFFSEQGIDCHLLQGQKEWTRFLGYYSDVIEDCPLKYQDGRMSAVRKSRIGPGKRQSPLHVRTLLVRKAATDSYSNENQVSLRLEWRWVHDDGTETTIIDSTLVYPPNVDEDEPHSSSTDFTSD